ncbi:MAG TPA: PaaI family thioesterase [Marmoricola sp.]|nr:PaaI family thioesterase [Marmoricola sp.]
MTAIDPRDRLVRATRRLAAAVGRTDVDAEAMRLTAQQIEELVPPLEEQAYDRVPRTPFDAAVGADEYAWQVHNPAMPGIRMRFVDGEARAELASLSHLYEGPEGYVHGGVSAMLMDCMLSSVVQYHGFRAVTASLTTDYRRPTPLGRPLTLTGRVVEISERKAMTSGELICDGLVRIEARALMIRV